MPPSYLGSLGSVASDASGTVLREEPRLYGLSSEDGSRQLWGSNRSVANNEYDNGSESDVVRSKKGTGRSETSSRNASGDEAGQSGIQELDVGPGIGMRPGDETRAWRPGSEASGWNDYSYLNSGNEASRPRSGNEARPRSGNEASSRGSWQ